MAARKRKDHRGTGFPNIFSAAVMLFSIIYWLPRDFNIGGGGWWMCLTYVGEGTLYGGQAFCAQGPVIYYIGYILREIFGSGLLLPVMQSLTAFSQVIMFIALAQIFKKHGVGNWVAYPLLFSVLVSRLSWEMTSTYATCFFVLGIYILETRPSRVGYISSSIFFTIAIFTKYTTLIPIIIYTGFIYLHEPWLNAKKDEKMRALNRGLARITQFYILLAVTAMIFYQLHPNIISYTISGHASQVEKSTYESIISFVFEPTLNSIAFTLFFMILAYSVIKGLFKARPLVWTYCQIAIFIQGIMFYLSIGNTNFGSYYMLPAYTLLIGVFLELLKKDINLMTILVITCFVYPSFFMDPLQGITKSGFDEMRVDAVRTIEYGVHFIPRQEKKILVEGDFDILVEYGVDFDPSQVTVIPKNDEEFLGSHEDPLWAPKIREVMNLSKGVDDDNAQDLTEAEKRVEQMILDKEFSLIIFGPPSWASIYRLLERNDDFFEKGYCAVQIPNFMYQGAGRTQTTLIFSEKKDCESMKLNLWRYYNDRFFQICAYGIRSAKVVKMVMEHNHIEIAGDCRGPTEFIYANEKKYLASMLDFIWSIIWFPPVLWACKRIKTLGALNT